MRVRLRKRRRNATRIQLWWKDNVLIRRDIAENRTLWERVLLPSTEEEDQHQHHSSRDTSQTLTALSSSVLTNTSNPHHGSSYTGHHSYGDILSFTTVECNNESMYKRFMLLELSIVSKVFILSSTFYRIVALVPIFFNECNE
jgi:hypothetical protein